MTVSPTKTEAGKYPPTIDEMRRVARYLSEEMALHSAAGKLLAKAELLERTVDEFMKVRR